MEECDSTWGSDSESEEQQEQEEAAEDDSGISESLSPSEAGRYAADPGDMSPQVAYLMIEECVWRGQHNEHITII